MTIMSVYANNIRFGQVLPTDITDQIDPVLREKVDDLIEISAQKIQPLLQSLNDLMTTYHKNEVIFELRNRTASFVKGVTAAAEALQQNKFDNIHDFYRNLDAVLSNRVGVFVEYADWDQLRNKVHAFITKKDRLPDEAQEEIIQIIDQLSTIRDEVYMLLADMQPIFRSNW